MVMSDQLFVDSNFFIALFHQQDSLHEQALSIAKNLDRQWRPLVISNFVFLEVVTVLSQRKSRAQAREAGKFFLSDPGIVMHHIDEKLQQASWNIFQTVGRKGMSFVDCSIVALMQSEGIHTLLTFDQTDFRSLQKTFRFSLYER